MIDESPFPYEGPDALQHPVLAALQRVVDPEVALSIVDVGLVYGVTVSDDRLHVRLTMTSAACPVANVIVADVERAMDAGFDDYIAKPIAVQPLLQLVQRTRQGVRPRRNGPQGTLFE